MIFIVLRSDRPRDRREEPVRDRQQRLVEVRARVDAPGRRNEDVQHPGVADVHAHARHRRVPGGHRHERSPEVLQQQADHEHIFVAHSREGQRPALKVHREALLHGLVALAHGHAQVPGEDAVVHQYAVHVARHEDVCDYALDVLRVAAPAEERRRGRRPCVEVRVLADDRSFIVLTETKFSNCTRR